MLSSFSLLFKSGLIDHHTNQSGESSSADIITTMKTVKFLLVIFVSLVFAGPSQGNPPNTWFSALNSNDVISKKDAEVVLILFLILAQ